MTDRPHILAQSVVHTSASCPRCEAAPLDVEAYAELLGWYLGDGCLTVGGRDVYALHVFNDSKYVTLNDRIPRLLRRAGRKHERPIVLEPWQQAIVDAHPGPLLRGLFHSDGCRVTNWTVRPLRDGPKRYEYPRYLFSNESTDILAICTDALDAIGVRWTAPRRNVVSVARRESVAKLDQFVGPKS